MSESRLNPALLVHAATVAGRRRLIAEVSSASPPLILNDPVALLALSRLPARFDRVAASRSWADAGIAERDHEQLWSAFVGARVVIDATGESGDSWWSELGWREARAYHLATRDYPFVQMDEAGAFTLDAERMDSYSAAAVAPSPYLEHGTSARIELDPLGDVSPDDRAALMSADQRLGLPGLGLLLDVCFGERGTVATAGGVRCLLKSVPSGGARHPTEVYVASLEIAGIPAGIYHYNVRAHRLDRLRAGDESAALAHATYDLFAKHTRPPSAVLIFTSLLERAMWRYRDPRSFRAILLDVGHAVAAYRHAARLLGFRTYALQKMRDAEIAGLLGVDPVTQPPLYAASLVRPDD